MWRFGTTLRGQSVLVTQNELRFCNVQSTLVLVSRSVSEEWVRFVAALAEAPQMCHRLMYEHRPNTFDRCVACTTPGRGTPSAKWPCSLFLIARAALEMAGAQSSSPDPLPASSTDLTT